MVKAKSITGAVLVILFLLSVLLGGFIFPQTALSWEGIYGVEFADPGDFPDLASRGVNTNLVQIGAYQGAWESYYSAALANNIKLIAMLWGNGQTIWSWNAGAGEWELSISRYPYSIGAQFLNFLRNNPTYLAYTLAIYSFHEPFNPENPGTNVSAQQMRKFWQQIHQEEFPGGTLKIYGESVAWDSGCHNGCVDYHGITLFSFAHCGSGGLYRELSGIYYGGCTSDEASAIASAQSKIDWYYSTIHSAVPAPDGSYTQNIGGPQTFAFEYPAMGIWNRMPEAWEMYDWGAQIVGARKDKLAGMLWYPYRFGSLYDYNLHDDRYDNSGRDRWQIINDVAAVLGGGGPPPPPPPPPPPMPTVDLKANGTDGPITIDYATSATLSWTSANASYCVASGDWSGMKVLSGSESTGNLTFSRTYTLSCSGTGGTASDSVSVNVGQEPPPVASKLSLTASPTTVVADGVSTSQIRASVLDEQDNLVTDSQAVITFYLTGSGSLEGANPVQAVHGVASITYRAGIYPDTVTITADSPGLTEDSVNLTLISIGPEAGLELYGVKFAGTADYQELAAMGVMNPVTIVANNSEVDNIIQAARTISTNYPDFKPILWQWPEGWSGEGVNSIGQAFINHLNSNSYWGDILAIYGLHEPLGGYALPITQIQSIHGQIKQLSGNQARIFGKAYSDTSYAGMDYADGIYDYCAVMYHPFRANPREYRKDQMLADLERDLNLIKSVPPGQTLNKFIPYLCTIHWPDSGVYGTGLYMPAPEEMEDAGVNIIEYTSSGGYSVDGFVWYTWDDNSGWVGLDKYNDDNQRGDYQSESGRMGVIVRLGQDLPPPPPVPTVDLKANGTDGPISIAYDTSATLTWSSSDADSCDASDDWSGPKPLSGSEETGSLIYSRTYTLTCSGPGGTASDSVTVNIGDASGDTVIYYFDGYDASKPAWTNATQMVNGDIGSHAWVGQDGASQYLNSSDCPGQDLGEINKVELRVHGAAHDGEGNDQIILRPIFAAGTGNNHQLAMSSSPSPGKDWSAWTDITNDANAPSGWNWSDVQNLDCEVIHKQVGNLDYMLASKVEIRLTYGTPPEPDIPGDANGDGEVNIADLVIVGSSFGLKEGDPGYDPRADVAPHPVGNKEIDIADLVTVGTHFGEGI